jgi:hypothetical protein
MTDTDRSAAEDFVHAKFWKEGENEQSAMQVEFNPDSLQYDLINQLEAAKGNTSGRPPARPVQYVQQSSARLSMDLVFDSTTDGGDVRVWSKKFIAFMKPDESNGKKTPPRINFAWGAFKFTGFIESYKEVLDFFSVEGIPLRAKLSLVLTDQGLDFTAATEASGKSANVDNESFSFSANDDRPLGEQLGGGTTGHDAGAANDMDSIRRPPTGETAVGSGHGGAPKGDCGGGGGNNGAGNGNGGGKNGSGGGGGDPRAGFGRGKGLDGNTAGSNSGGGRFGGAGAGAGAGAGFGASAGASFGASAGAGASFGASAAAGASVGAFGGFSAAAGAQAGGFAAAGVSAGGFAGGSAGGFAGAGASAGAFAGAGASAGAFAGAGASAGAFAGAGASAGAFAGAGAGGTAYFGAGASASWTATASAGASVGYRATAGAATWASSSAQYNVEAGLRQRYGGLWGSRPMEARLDLGALMRQAAQPVPTSDLAFLPGGQAIDTSGGFRADVRRALVLRNGVRFEEP